MKDYLTQMNDPGNVLEIRDLQTGFVTEKGFLPVVDGVSFDLPAGKTVALVGESGCGKSVTSLSVMQLLQRPQGRIAGGCIRFALEEGAIDIAKAPESVMAQLRGGKLSMIFQEPMTALNPVLTVGKQVAEAVRLHDSRGKDKAFCRQKAISLLEQVGIPDSPAVYQKYPHQLSGGMRQRVVIAMALAADPRLIIADEPTTALDVTIQAQILELLRQLKEQKGCAILLITHDLGVVAQMADFVVVMYAGRVVEQGTVTELFAQPAHPYTRALMAAKPVVGQKNTRLYAIGGSVPDPRQMPSWCRFRDRCEGCLEHCGEGYPAQISLSPTHKVSCWQYAEEAKNGG